MKVLKRDDCTASVLLPRPTTSTPSMQTFRGGGLPADPDVGWVGPWSLVHPNAPAVGSVNAVVPGLSEAEIIAEYAGHDADDRVATIRARMSTPPAPPQPRALPLHILSRIPAPPQPMDSEGMLLQQDRREQV